MNIRKNEEPVFSDSGTYSRLITPEYCTTAETRDSRTKTYWSRAEKVANSKTEPDQEMKSWETQDRLGPEKILKISANSDRSVPVPGDLWIPG